MNGKPPMRALRLTTLAVLALAGCASPEPGAFPEPTVRKAKVSEITATLSLPLPSPGGALSAADHARTTAFFDAYREGGRGPVLAVITAPDRTAAAHAAAILRRLATGRGLSDNAVVVSSAIGSPPGMVLRYSDYVAAPLECAPEIALSFNPTHATSPNLGCAIDKNIAAMVANPADLLGPATATAADGTRIGRAIDLYHQGKATQAEVNRNDSLQLSTVASGSSSK